MSTLEGAVKDSAAPGSAGSAAAASAGNTAPASAIAEWRCFWTVPLSAALGYSTAVIHVYAIGPFMAPLQQEFSWSRAQIAAGLTISGLVGALFSVGVGRLVDRVGPRPVGLAGVLLMTAAWASLGTATGTTQNWLLLWSLIAAANLLQQATIWTSAVASRFEKSRGLAFAVTFSGASISATVFPLLATWLIKTYDWRTAFMAMGAIWAVVVFPLMLLFFRGAQDGRGGRNARAAAAAESAAKAPAAGPAPKAPAASTAPGVTVAEGLRMPAFYQLLIASGLFTFTALGIIVHFVPILKDRGADPLAAAGIAALIGIFSIIGRLGTGFLLDRFAANRVGALVFLLPIVACSLLFLDGANPMSQSVAAACFGLTVGAEVDVIAYLASRHFGLRNYGVLFGAMIGALALGTAFGPLAAGAAFDRWGSYVPFLWATIGFMLASSLALVTLGRPRFGVQGAH